MKTRFEKLIEAFYCFNKNDTTKEQVHKLAVKEWSRIKEGDEVEKVSSKHNEQRRKEETTEAGKSKKKCFLFQM